MDNSAFSLFWSRMDHLEEHIRRQLGGKLVEERLVIDIDTAEAFGQDIRVFVGLVFEPAFHGRPHEIFIDRNRFDRMLVSFVERDRNIVGEHDM